MRSEKTQKLLDSFIEKPSSSLLIVGNEEMGAKDCVVELSSRLLGKSYAGNRLTIEPEDGKSIGIDVTRELKQRLATIAGQDQPITRIACVMPAESLTEEAQNALLKLIEEPVKNTLLILVASSQSLLLDTITSRCQTIQLLPITQVQAAEYCETKGIDQESCKKAYLLSQGAPKLFLDLVNKSESQLIGDIETAKQFLRDSTFMRLSRQKEFDSSDRLTALVKSLQRVAEAGLHGSNAKTSKRWQKALKELRESTKLLRQNTNTKLVYLRISIML